MKEAKRGGALSHHFSFTIGILPLILLWALSGLAGNSNVCNGSFPPSYTWEGLDWANFLSSIVCQPIERRRFFSQIIWAHFTNVHSACVKREHVRARVCVLFVVGQATRIGFNSVCDWLSSRPYRLIFCLSGQIFPIFFICCVCMYICVCVCCSFHSRAYKRNHCLHTHCCAWRWARRNTILIVSFTLNPRLNLFYMSSCPIRIAPTFNLIRHVRASFLVCPFFAELEYIKSQSHTPIEEFICEKTFVNFCNKVSRLSLSFSLPDWICRTLHWFVIRSQLNHV